MSVPRSAPLLEQFDFAVERLHHRLTGPTVDSGDGEFVEVPPITDEEYLWLPTPDSLSIRRRSDGPGPGATRLVGAGEWQRDSLFGSEAWPAPLSNIAWRLAHLSEMLSGRADYTTGSKTFSAYDYEFHGEAAAGIEAFDVGAAAWREAVDSADDSALDQVGRSSYIYGSDPEEPFLQIVWWVNQEVLHHGAEIALLRDLYRAYH